MAPQTPVKASAKPSTAKASTAKCNATKKIVKKTKNPNAPKRPLSAYLWFCQAKRAGIKKAHPAWSTPEIAKELGVQWRQASDKDKKKYEEQATKDKARYAEEVKAVRGA